MKPLSCSVLYMVLGLTPGKWNGEGPLGERRESIDHRGSHRNPLQNCFKKYWILGTIPRHSDLIDLRCRLCIRILQISLLKIRCIARAETLHITLFRNTAPYLPENSAHSALAQCHSRHSRWKCLEELLVASAAGMLLVISLYPLLEKPWERCFQVSVSESVTLLNFWFALVLLTCWIL